MPIWHASMRCPKAASRWAWPTASALAPPAWATAWRCHVGLLYVRLAQPIAFDSPDGKPVRDVVVLLVPEKACQQHLDILADVSRLFANRRLRKQLHQCETVEAVRALLE